MTNQAYRLCRLCL